MTYNCLNCGKENKSTHQKTNKYCNVQCQKDFEYTKSIENWKITGNISKHTLKRYLLKINDTCWECGIKDWNDKPIVLELEHIDGNAFNNFEGNVSLLCPNCHSQTPTYKNKNRGNGRQSRIKRQMPV